MADFISMQDLVDAKRDISDLGLSINTDGIITPRYGAAYDSLPKVIREMIEQKNLKLAELQTAIDTAVAAGVGAAGWHSYLVLHDNGETQKQINDYIGATWYARVGGYGVNAKARLDTGEIVVSIIDENTNDPNSDMTGWVKQIADSTYYVESAGVKGDGVTDNTELYTSIINALPEHSTIKFDGTKTYVGGFVSSKSFKIDGNGATFHPNAAGNLFSFVSAPIDVSILETEITKDTYAVTVAGTPTIPDGSILVLWAGDMRDASNAVNFETLKVSSTSISGTDTIVNFETPTAGYKAGVITADVYTNPITKPKLLNISAVNTNVGNLTRWILFKGCLEPFVDEIHTDGSLGHAISFEECYRPKSGDVYCKNPQGVGSGEGYGLTSYKSSHCDFGKVFANGMRHALDLSSTHYASCDYVEDLDAKAVIAMASHNGFCSNINIKKVFGITKTAGAHGVATSYQGYRTLSGGSYVVDNAKRLLNPVHNVKIGDVHIVAEAPLTSNSSIRCVSLDTELGANCSIGDLLLEVKSTESPLSTAQANPLQISGQCDSLTVSSISVNRSGLGIRITNDGTSPNLGKISINRISLGLSHYGAFIRGYDVFANEYIYEKINRPYVFEVTALSGVPDPKYLEINSLRQKHADTSKMIQSILSTVPAFDFGSIHSDTRYMQSPILVTTTVGITLADISRRGFQNAYLIVSGGSASTLPSVVIPALPAPIYSNGQRMTIANSTPNSNTATEVTIAAGSTALAHIVIPSGTAVDLISIAGIWRIR